MTKLHFNKTSQLSFILVIALIFPAFGGIWGERHVLFIFIMFAFAVTIAAKSNFNINNLVPVIFFFTIQLLCVVSWSQDIINGKASTSDLPSLLRPTALALLYTGFFSFIPKTSHIKALEKFILPSTIVIFIALILSRTYSGYEQLSEALYFPLAKFRDNAFISFFGTTYFAAYFYYIIFLFAACRISFYRCSKTWTLVLLASLAFIFLSQGKSAFIAVIFSIFIIIFFKSGVILRGISLIVASSLSLLIYYFNDSTAAVLQSADSFTLHQLSLFIDQGYNFGSVENRLQQFHFTLKESMDNYLFGVGLGRGIYLESYLSAYTYRYGILGLIAYQLLYITIAIRSLISYINSSSPESKTFYMFCFLWFLNIPVLMISNPMFEMGKNAIFSLFILALFFSFESPQRIKNSKYHSNADKLELQRQ